MSEPGPPTPEILVLFDESDAALRTEPRRSLELAQRALDLCPEPGGLRARALLKNAVAHFALGEPGSCPHLLEQSVALARRFGDPRTAFTALTNLGVVSANTGDLARAVAAYEQALATARTCVDDPGSLGVLNNLGAVHGRMGDLDAALSCFQDALRLAEQSGQDLHLAYGLVNQAQALQQLGRHDQALAAWQRAEQLLGPEHALHAHVLCGLGSARTHCGDPTAGLSLIDRAVVQARAHEHPLDVLGFRLERGMLGLAHADPDAAREELREVLDEATARELPHLAIRACEALAASLADRGDHAQAWDLSQTLRELERRQLDAENAKALRQLTQRHQAEIHKLRNVELAQANAALKEHQDELVEARDQAQAADRAKTSFLANLSHDIRTPLNGVMGLTEALLRGRLEPEQRRLLETIHASGSLTLSILGDVLDLSRLESGRQEAACDPWSPRESVEDVVRILLPNAEARGLTLQVSLDPGLPEILLGDRTRVQQVLLNLVQNALKFTEHGTGDGLGGPERGPTPAAADRDRQRPRTARRPRRRTLRPILTGARRAGPGPGHGPWPGHLPPARQADGRDGERVHAPGRRGRIRAGAAADSAHARQCANPGVSADPGRRSRAGRRGRPGEPGGRPRPAGHAGAGGRGRRRWRPGGRAGLPGRLGPGLPGL